MDQHKLQIFGTEVDPSNMRRTRAVVVLRPSMVAGITCPPPDTPVSNTPPLTVHLVGGGGIQVPARHFGEIMEAINRD